MATVAGAIGVRILEVDAGRVGSWFGALILLATLAAMLTGMAGTVGWRRTLEAAVLISVLSAGVELLALTSAWPFGRYQYTDWWAPVVALPDGTSFPLLLGPTWFLFVTTCYLLLARRLSGAALVVATAFLAAGVDLTIEAVLTRVVDLWRWLEPTPLLGAPWRNFLGWLLVAGLAAILLEWRQVWRARGMASPPWLLATGLVGTAAIGLTHGQPSGALALLLLPVVLWAMRGPAGCSA